MYLQKVIQNQTELQLELRTGLDLSFASNAEIRYKKPDGETGHFPATIDTGRHGVMFYNVQSANDIDQTGDWTIWAYAEFPSGNVVYGEATYFTVEEEGSL